jgi:hypothetical protein
MMSNAWVAGPAAAALLLVGCGGAPDAAAGLPDEVLNEELDLGEATADGTADAAAEDAADEPVVDDRLPDVVGLPSDEAVATLEELGFEVRTGVVFTTETAPDLVHRSEPAPGALVRPGQGIVLRVAAEPEG